MKRLIRAALLALTIAAISAAATSAATPATPAFTQRIPVLMYHRIQCEVTGKASNAGLFVCPAQLDAEMAALEERGWHTVTAGQLAEAMLSRTCLAPKTFVITVDDGALDGYTAGAPIFDAHGFDATYAIVVGKVGLSAEEAPAKPHFSWDQARDLIARGHELANHTWTHSSVRTLSDAKLDAQVIRSSDTIEAETGIRPRIFVYPYGAFSDASAAKLEPLFDMAFTTQAEAPYSTDRLTEAPRLRVSRSTTVAGLLEKMGRFAQPCPA